MVKRQLVVPQLACTIASILNSFSSDHSPTKPVLLKHWGWPTAEEAHRYSWCRKEHLALRLPKSSSFVYYKCIRPIPAKILLHFHIKFHMLVFDLKSSDLFVTYLFYGPVDFSARRSQPRCCSQAVTWCFWLPRATSCSPRLQLRWAGTTCSVIFNHPELTLMPQSFLLSCSLAAPDIPLTCSTAPSLFPFFFLQNSSFKRDSNDNWTIKRNGHYKFTTKKIQMIKKEILILFVFIIVELNVIQETTDPWVFMYSFIACTIYV